MTALIVLLFGAILISLFTLWAKKKGFFKVQDLNRQYDDIFLMLDALEKRELSMKTMKEHSDECGAIQDKFSYIVRKTGEFIPQISFKGIWSRMLTNMLLELTKRGDQVSDRIIADVNRRRKVLDEESERIARDRAKMDDFYSRKSGS